MTQHSPVKKHQRTKSKEIPSTAKKPSKTPKEKPEIIFQDESKKTISLQQTLDKENLQSLKMSTIQPESKKEKIPQPNFPPQINNLMVERLNLEKQFIQQSLNSLHMQQQSH